MARPSSQAHGTTRSKSGMQVSPTCECTPVERSFCLQLKKDHFFRPKVEQAVRQKERALPPLSAALRHARGRIMRDNPRMATRKLQHHIARRCWDDSIHEGHGAVGAGLPEPRFGRPAESARRAAAAGCAAGCAAACSSGCMLAERVAEHMS